MSLNEDRCKRLNMDGTNNYQVVNISVVSNPILDQDCVEITPQSSLGRQINNRQINNIENSIELEPLSEIMPTINSLEVPMVGDIEDEPKVSICNSTSSFLDLPLTLSEQKVHNLMGSIEDKSQRKVINRWKEKEGEREKELRSPMIFSKSVEFVVPTLQSPKKMTQYFTSLGKIKIRKRLNLEREEEEEVKECKKVKRKDQKIVTPPPPPRVELLKEKGIFNLSKYIVSWDEVEVLEKGLSFCPTSGMNLFEVFFRFK